MFQGADRGAQVVHAKSARESVLDADADSRVRAADYRDRVRINAAGKILATDQAGKVLRDARVLDADALALPVRFPKHT